MGRKARALTEDKEVGGRIPLLDGCTENQQGGREGKEGGERRHYERTWLLTAGVESLLEDELGNAETNGSGPGALPGSPKVTESRTHGMSIERDARIGETDLEHRKRREKGKGGWRTGWAPRGGWAFYEGGADSPLPPTRMLARGNRQIAYPHNNRSVSSIATSPGPLRRPFRQSAPSSALFHSRLTIDTLVR